jgi:hypothetical protein
MMQYKLVKDKPDQVMYVNGSWHGIIPFVSGNTDYQTFKKAILAETAELQNDEGATMSAAEAQEYVATLP